MCGKQLMNDSQLTHPTLLLRLAQGQDDATWRRFVDIYAPIVFQFARARGLQDSDAADVVQEVLVRVAEAFRRRKYDPSRGRFRGWLLTIARNEVADWYEARDRRENAGGGTTVQRRLGELEQRQEELDWRKQYGDRLLAWAVEQVRHEVEPKTWEAFWQTALEEKTGQAVALSLGMTVAAVYLARSRVLRRLRAVVADVDPSAWEWESEQGESL